MKDKLTPEQSQRLIELGVDPSKASGEKVFIDIHPEALKGNADYAKPWGFIPTFTLSDILSLLPKEFILPFTDMINRMVFEWSPIMKQWHAAYKHIDKEWLAASFLQDEPIDALYMLLVWCLTNKYMKV